MNDDINHTLEINGKLFLETNKLIVEFKNFSFPNNKDKMSNFRHIKMMESTESQLKHEFDSITYKITKQNKSIIDSARNSIRYSNMNLTSVDDEKKESNMKKMEMMNSEDLLYEDKIKEKEEQIAIIQK